MALRFGNKLFPKGFSRSLSMGAELKGDEFQLPKQALAMEAASVAPRAVVTSVPLQSLTAGQVLAAPPATIESGLYGPESDVLSMEARQGGLFGPESAPPVPGSVAAPLGTVDASPSKPKWLNPFIAGMGAIATSFAQTPGQLAAGKSLSDYGTGEMIKEDERKAQAQGWEAGMAGKPMAENMDSKSYQAATMYKMEQDKFKEEQKRTESLIKNTDASTAHKVLETKMMQEMGLSKITDVNGNSFVMAPDKAAAHMLNVDELEWRKYTGSAQVDLMKIQMQKLEQDIAEGKQTVTLPNGVGGMMTIPATEHYKIIAGMAEAKMRVGATMQAHSQGRLDEYLKANQAEVYKRETQLYDDASKALQELYKNTAVDSKGNPSLLQQSDIKGLRANALSRALTLYHTTGNEYYKRAANAMVGSLGKGVDPKIFDEEQKQIVKGLGLLQGKEAPVSSNQAPMLPKIPAKPPEWVMSRPPGAAGGLIGLPADMLKQAPAALAESNKSLQKASPVMGLTPTNRNYPKGWLEKSIANMLNY